MTRDKKMIQMLNNNDFPNFWRVLIGNCTWGPGQLESELLEVGSTVKACGMCYLILEK